MSGFKDLPLDLVKAVESVMREDADQNNLQSDDIHDECGLLPGERETMQEDDIPGQDDSRFDAQRDAKEKEEKEDLEEKAPSDEEDWASDPKVKASFQKQYGDRWKEVMYATAWRKHNNESVQENFNIGDTVKPNTGPHAGHPHKVIHVYPDGRVNIQPIGLPPKKIQYRLGAAMAHPHELVKEGSEWGVYHDSKGLLVKFSDEEKAKQHHKQVTRDYMKDHPEKKSPYSVKQVNENVAVDSNDLANPEPRSAIGQTGKTSDAAYKHVDVVREDDFRPVAADGKHSVGFRLLLQWSTNERPQFWPPLDLPAAPTLEALGAMAPADPEIAEAIARAANQPYNDPHFKGNDRK